MDEWQNIETAPRDGSFFLAHYSGKHGPRVGVMQWWNDRFHSWETATRTTEASHWMPLPAPPPPPETVK